jgi:hypothetical protein
MYRRIAGLVAVAAVFAMLAPMAWSASETEKDAEGRVAVVNGEPISRAALEQEMTPVRHRMGMTGEDADETKLDEIRKQVLDNLIRRELIFQESKKKGFTVEDSAVQERFDALKSRFPSSEQFQAMMAQMNFTEEILNCLTQGAGDENWDGIVSTTELRTYVTTAVAQATDDAQHPTVDRENIYQKFGFPVK